MFSKALLKQSHKANGTMWGIITFAVCFMLACVMLISGNGNIGEVKDSIEDTIIIKEVDSDLERRALSYYNYAADGLEKFDELFYANVKDSLSYLTWCSAMPSSELFDESAAYSAAFSAWQQARPTLTTNSARAFAESIEAWQNSMPAQADYDDINDYIADMQAWKESSPATLDAAVTAAYTDACRSLREYVEEKARAAGYDADSTESAEMLGSVMYTLDPNGAFDEFYIENGEDAPQAYDITSIISTIATGEDMLETLERVQYREKRARYGASVFLADNMLKSESVDALVDALSSYGVTREKYDSFGYTYDAVKHMASTAIVTYTGRLDYELSFIEENDENGVYASREEYERAISEKRDEFAAEVSSSFLSTLPTEVSDALEEIGQADLYTLIVGSIFYKLAGLLLPIIYMIMASNNLIAGQVDSGSMAYVLSTSTKRSSVIFTQAVYLIGSLLAMFSLTSLTGCVCLALITEEVELTYGKLILLNLGAFLVLFTLSGLCFFTSCVFDHSKRSMAIGGGLSIFALVAAMLGLFGSPVIPSVVRLDALNNFNYTSIISLFDVISIIDGTDVFVAKFIILGVLGILGYIAGALRFTKKDLPL